MSGLNIILGYDNDADRYICGIYLFWTLYEWVPLWGTILSLLFLSRTAMHNSRNRTGTNRSMVSDDTASTLDYTNSSRGQHPSNPSASRRQPNNSNTTMMYDDTSITAPLVEEGISDEETDMSEGTLEGMSDGSGISGERRSLYETPAQKIQNNAYYTDITQNDGEHYMDDEEDQDVDSRMRLTQATCITEDDIGPFRNRTDRTGPYHLNDTPTDSMQNQSDLYNYDIQNAMTGGNYSYRYSTMTNNQETNDNV